MRGKYKGYWIELNANQVQNLRFMDDAEVGKFLDLYIEFNKNSPHFLKIQKEESREEKLERILSKNK